VSELIGPEQTAYIPGRIINENIRSMLMTVDLANLDNTVDGIIVSLDAKKAFDSVDHGYICKVLEAFGLKDFVPIFRLLYSNLSSDIILNGKIVKGFRIKKGVKQGDALSCILFIMCMEPLIRNIKANPIIQRITSLSANVLIPKIYSFADDINVVIKNSPEGLQAIFDEYSRITRCSGLTLNADKTEVFNFNSMNNLGNYRVTYLNQIFDLRGQSEIKINGIFFQMNPNQREVKNVEKVVAAMDKQMQLWSKRRLSLLGKILILKTFVVSQMIYLFQTMSISEVNLKLLERMMFKFIWNRSYNAAKAPERLKREIMLTPISKGGFGMLNIRDLNRSLIVRNFARLLSTNHPLLKQVRETMTNRYFAVAASQYCDAIVHRGIKYVTEDRQVILNWETHDVTGNRKLAMMLTNTKLTDLLTPAGKRTLTFISIRSRTPDPRLRHVMRQEMMLLSRFVKFKQLIPSLLMLIDNPINGAVDEGSMYPIRNRQIADLTKLTSREIRTCQADGDDPICIYKVGLILAPAEVLAWTNKLRKLTSVRHRSNILRIAHGEIYSNGRLHKFGLIDSPKCNNCQEPTESIVHKLIECDVAKKVWMAIKSLKDHLDFDMQHPVTVEEALGVLSCCKLSMAINAEALTRIIAQGGKVYNPESVVSMIIKSISTFEPLPIEVKNKIKEWTDNRSGSTNN
jgi:hypothetical protein